MFVRFQAAILLAASAAVAAGACEKAALDYRRSIGRQHYRIDVLHERVARLRLRVEEAGGPTRLVRPAEPGRLAPASEASDESSPSAPPVLRWRIAPEARS